MLLQVALFHSILWGLNNILYLHHIFIHSSVNEHLACFHELAIVNIAAGIFLNYNFVLMYAQKSNCWFIQQLYF